MVPSFPSSPFVFVRATKTKEKKEPLKQLAFVDWYLSSSFSFPLSASLRYSPPQRGGSMISSAYAACCFAAGVLGNLFALVLFVSPFPTFRRIIRNGSTEQFSGLPYIYSLLNCLICLWYGLPFVKSGIILVATVNSIGACFHLVYISLYITYTDQEKKLKMSAMLITVLGIFAALAFVSLEYFSSSARRIFVGYLTVASLISMFASPLFIINLVIRMKSVEFMPFYLSLATFLMSFSFFMYGFLEHDAFIYVPNGIGTLLGIAQLVIYIYYSRQSSKDVRMPLLVSHQ